MENKMEEWVRNCLNGNVSCRGKEKLNKIATWLENEKAAIGRLRLQRGETDSYVMGYSNSVVNAEVHITRILNE